MESKPSVTCIDHTKVSFHATRQVKVSSPRVMPKRVIDLFHCWLGSVGRNSVIWKAIPHCIMWCLWRERNARTFEDCELSVVELKLHFYRSLLDWMSATGLFRLSNMLDLIDYCYF
jgi:hypothetical protein